MTVLPLPRMVAHSIAKATMADRVRATGSNDRTGVSNTVANAATGSGGWSVSEAGSVAKRCELDCSEAGAGASQRASGPPMLGEGEIGWLFDENSNLVEPIERPVMGEQYCGERLAMDGVMPPEQPSRRRTASYFPTKHRSICPIPPNRIPSEGVVGYRG